MENSQTDTITQNTVEESAENVQKRQQEIFEGQFRQLYSQLQDTCRQLGMVAAVALAVDNKGIVYIMQHGHRYDQAVLLTSALRKAKEQINEDLKL